MRPVWKWISGGVLLFFIGIGSAIWYYSHNWKPILEHRLQEVVKNATDSLYRLSYADLDLNIALGSVTLRNAELAPDSAVYQDMVRRQTAPNNRYHIKVESLKVRRFSLKDLLADKKLNIKTILFENPEIHVMSERHTFNDTIAEDHSRTLYESIKGVFTSVNVKDIRFGDVKFKYTIIEEGKGSDIQLDQVNVTVHDVLVDETSLSDTSRLYYTKMVDVNIPGFEYELSDGYYKVKFDDLRINTRDQNVLFTKVIFAPKVSRQSFYRNKKQNITMVALQFDTLRFERLDFKRIIEDQQTIATKVQLKDGKIDLYSDKRYPKYPVNKIGQSPHQKLMQAVKLLRIDTLLVDNITVTYRQFSEKFHQEGVISFDHAQGYLTNVTNDTAALYKDKYMRANLSSNVMHKGVLHVKFGFDMLSADGFHTYQGTLGSMDATAFNRILHPLLNVEIASGNIHKVAFDMKGNDYKNWGEFRFDYDDLKINLFNRPQHGEEAKSKKLTSFLVNEIIINNSNPLPDGMYTVAKVEYTRDKEHTFFKTTWQSLLEGIKQCAGISPEREARLMGTAEVAVDVVKGAKRAVKDTGVFFKRLFKKKEDTKGGQEEK